MKAVVLAAGKGTRMLPITEHVPKVLVPVNGRPFLGYVLENLQKAGFNEIALVVGYKKEKVAEFVQENGFDVTLIEQTEQKGTGDALRCARKFCGNDDFIVVAGDSLISIEDFKGLHDQEGCYIVGKEVAHPQKYGILFEEEGKLQKIVEKPKTFVGNFANIGLYRFTPQIWSALAGVGLSQRGEIELTDAVTAVAQYQNVGVVPLAGYWLDMGCIEDIPKVEAFLSNGSSVQHIECEHE